MISNLKSESKRSILQSLGLSKYEILAYLTLVEDGPQNSSFLANRLKIPSGKIYRVMKILEKKGWVNVPSSERPKIFYAIDPEIAINLRIDEMKNNLSRIEIKTKKLSSTLKSLFYQNSAYIPTKSEYLPHDIARKKVLAALSPYLGMRWASLIDTSSKSIVWVHSRSVGPEHLNLTDIHKNVAVIETTLEEKYEDLKKIETCVQYENDQGCFIYSPIDDRYGLILNLPPNTPFAPVEAVCEHVRLVLRELLNTNQQ